MVRLRQYHGFARGEWPDGVFAIPDYIRRKQCKPSLYVYLYHQASDGVMPTESTNKADLTPPNGKDSISTGDKGVNPGPYNPLAKTAGTVTLSKDEKRRWSLGL